MIEIAPEFFALGEEFRPPSVASSGIMRRRSMSNFTKNPLQVAETIEAMFGEDL